MLRKNLYPIVCALSLCVSLAAAQSQPDSGTLPKIRTITAFVRLDRQTYRKQVESALVMLKAAKTEFTKAGYEIETLRITTQPFPEIVKGLTPEQALAFFHEYDALALQEGFTPDIGPAMVKDNDDPAQADLLAQIITTTQSVNGFVAVAGDDGIHWNSVRAAAHVIKYLEEHTVHSEGNFRFAAGAFPPAIAPFFPVSHTSGAGHQFAIGMESANIAQEVFGQSKGDFSGGSRRLTDALGIAALKVEALAQGIEAKTGWKYEGIDLTPVPLKEISIGAALESLLGDRIGSPGSLSSAYAITSAMGRVPVKHAGYSGLMLPVLEDAVLAKRWEEGAIGRDALMSYSSVCSTGLDAIPLPGEISQQSLENIIADMASLAVKWHKPLSVRLLPVAGKRAGEMTEFSSPYLVNIHIR
ncbi:MAG TPA: DUF711 family protein [Candidatus Angelobacter sp.]|nr:DUF711 family protein [Candidatus Angelobacter sp.]